MRLEDRDGNFARSRDEGVVRPFMLVELPPEDPKSLAQLELVAFEEVCC